MSNPEAIAEATESVDDNLTFEELVAQRIARHSTEAESEAEARCENCKRNLKKEFYYLNSINLFINFFNF
jgi:hypothetical protein